MNKKQTPSKGAGDEGKIMKTIYKRFYDGQKEGFSDETRPNELLGTFEVKQQLFEDMYSEEFIGIRKEDGKKYLVRGDEVSGMYNPKNGGIRYSITEIDSTSPATAEKGKE